MQLFLFYVWISSLYYTSSPQRHRHCLEAHYSPLALLMAVDCHWYTVLEDSQCC